MPSSEYGACSKCHKGLKSINYSPSRHHGQYSITRIPVGSICVECKLIQVESKYSVSQITLGGKGNE